MTVSSVSSGSDAIRAAYRESQAAAAASVKLSVIHQGPHHWPSTTNAAGALWADRFRAYPNSCSRVAIVSGMSWDHFASPSEVLPVRSSSDQAARKLA